jgi:EAL domain-containing protein (putative c-di-GMP-specific phosphodiesterase class I)
MLADLFRRLRRLGCGRTLDDFDCASGEHARLGDLAVSTLNVDATLVVTGRFDVNSIVAAATTGGLPTACGIEVRAKRVESDELCAQMKRAGAHSLQGYAVARPRPLRALLADLASA